MEKTLNGSTKERPKTTYSSEYISERYRIDQLAKSIQNQVLQINKNLKLIQITDFSLKLNEPTEIAKKHTNWFQKLLLLITSKLWSKKMLQSDKK